MFCCTGEAVVIRLPLSTQSDLLIAAKFFRTLIVDAERPFLCSGHSGSDRLRVSSPNGSSRYLNLSSTISCCCFVQSEDALIVNCADFLLALSSSSGSLSSEPL